MPVTKRRRRYAREHNELVEGSTRWQTLMWGTTLFTDGVPFANDGEARAMWNENRDRLLKACGPGERPSAYFKFDLAITDTVVCKWFDQIHALLDRDLISAEEAQRCEQRHAELSASTDFGTSFASLNNIRRMGMDRIPPDLEKEFILAARWHAWRGRAKLAEEYLFRAANIYSAIKGAAA